MPVMCPSPELAESRSRLINSWPEIQIPVQEGSNDTAPASVRLYMLPIEAWYVLPRKVLKNDLQVFEDHFVSFVRNDREVHIGVVPELSGRRHADLFWLRIQVDFDGRLDEAFGVAMNKQGVRPKEICSRFHTQRDTGRSSTSPGENELSLGQSELAKEVQVQSLGR